MVRDQRSSRESFGVALFATYLCISVQKCVVFRDATLVKSNAAWWYALCRLLRGLGSTVGWVWEFTESETYGIRVPVTRTYRMTRVT